MKNKNIGTRNRISLFLKGYVRSRKASAVKKMGKKRNKNLSRLFMRNCKKPRKKIKCGEAY